jgi:uncharacterized protein YjbI with pentapeptide repeats
MLILEKRVSAVTQLSGSRQSRFASRSAFTTCSKTLQHCKSLARSRAPALAERAAVNAGASKSHPSRKLEMVVGSSLRAEVEAWLLDSAFAGSRSSYAAEVAYYRLMPQQFSKSQDRTFAGGPISTYRSTVLLIAAAASLSVDCARSRSSTAAKACDLRENGACPNSDLSHQQLEGMSLKGAILSKTFFVGANLTDADLSNADLRSADLSVATLVRTRLHGANLSGAVLQSVNARSADFQSATLQGAIVSGIFTGATFRNADLTGAISGNCLGNSPTSNKGARPSPVEERCALRHLTGRGIVCPDGTTEPDRGVDWANCSGHLTPTP